MYLSESDADPFSKSLENNLDKLRMGENKKIAAKDPSAIKTELQITERFILYSRENNKGMSAVSLANYKPVKKKAF